MKKAARSRKTKAPKQSTIRCNQCDNLIPARDKAYFVEEDVGRLFCSETCIVAAFRPEIEKLERLYGRYVSGTELTADQREQLSYLRWKCLEEPTEVYCEQTVARDKHFTLIREEKFEGKKVWGVSVCLMLRGEPSFLFIAFVTGDQALVNAFRRGEKMEIQLKEKKENSDSAGDWQTKDEGGDGETASDGDRLAESWTMDDAVRASIVKARKKNDIPEEDFAFYQKCIEETLQTPSELWSYAAGQQKKSKKAYHFIRRYEHDDPFWYIVIARDADDPSQIELIDAFPTRDAGLVTRVRHGSQERLPQDTESGDEAMDLPATGTDQKRKLH